ncbi:hypothetical protein [Pseudomonas oryzihabitans]|uniref:hypothetical protein n=1 Tax=Pseudomonas oryzihabitans TaxID=47885 RepID=UPI00285E0172|nr:hypothetical protein [Pseudomonas psychrotolerans]MDR6676240.1 hypothetical protein [Pseudomonas psychrotolerans]
MISRLDHIVYLLSDCQLDGVTEQLTRAGFMKHNRRVHHSNGSISVFFKLSGGYLELCTKSSGLECFEATHTSSIWLCLSDLAAAIGNLPNSKNLKVIRKTPLGDEEPAWLIANLPMRCAGEVEISLIEYLRGAGTDLTLQKSDNCLFAITAVSLRCDQPELDQCHYFAILSALTVVREIDRYSLSVGHQCLNFISRHTLHYSGAINLSDVLCLVHMATLDLTRTTSMLRAADFILEEVPGIGLLAQSLLAPSLCIVLDADLNPEWHHAQLLARCQ